MHGCHAVFGYGANHVMQYHQDIKTQGWRPAQCMMKTSHHVVDDSSSIILLMLTVPLVS